MARFRFGLASVLRQRAMAERRRQRAVAEVDAERVRLEGVVRECQRGIVRERVEQRAELAGPSDGGRGIDMAAVRLQAASALAMTARAQRTVLELAGVHHRLQAVRAELIEAAKRRRAVELLRERQLAAWTREQNRREGLELDEIALQLAARHGVG